MGVLPIRIFGDPVLRERASTVETFDEALRRLADDMLETMRLAGGAGLAGNQVGVLKRLFTWEIRDPAADAPAPGGGADGLPGALVNPEVLETSEEIEEDEEGCLSFPGLFYATRRPLEARLRAQDVTGEPLQIDSHGLMARVFLHEIDHLNGVLFIDHLARHDRKDALRRIRAGELEAPPDAREQRACGPVA